MFFCDSFYLNAQQQIQSLFEYIVTADSGLSNGYTVDVIDGSGDVYRTFPGESPQTAFHGGVYSFGNGGMECDSNGTAISGTDNYGLFKGVSFACAVKSVKSSIRIVYDIRAYNTTNSHDGLLMFQVHPRFVV